MNHRIAHVGLQIFAQQKPKTRPTPINKRKYKKRKKKQIKMLRAIIVHLEARLSEVSVSEPGEDALAQDVAVRLQGGVAAGQDVQSGIELLHRVHRGYRRSSSVKNTFIKHLYNHLLNF